MLICRRCRNIFTLEILIEVKNREYTFIEKSCVVGAKSVAQRYVKCNRCNLSIGGVVFFRNRPFLTEMRTMFRIRNIHFDLMKVCVIYFRSWPGKYVM